VVVTSAPWLLTSAVLIGLRLTAHTHGQGNFGVVEQIITIAYAVTVVLSAPVQVVVSRYAADRLYEHRLDAIASPLRRVLALTLFGFCALGAGVMVLLRVPLGIAIAGTMLTTVVGAQWLLLSVGSGLSSPGVVLRSFGYGAPVSVVAALVLERGMELGPIGYLCGFALGQLVTLVLLLLGITRAIPDSADEDARIWPACVEYRLLALSSFAYHLSIWADKAIVWLVLGRDVAALYTASAAFAWFSVIPAFAWIFVQIETVFYQRFRAFYGALEGGGTLAGLRQGALLLQREAKRIVRGASLVQAGVTGVAFMAAPRIMRMAGLPPEAVPLFRIFLLGAALQVITMLAVVLLYYFDRRRDALAVSLVLLIGNAALTLFCWSVGLPPSLGYVLACLVTCLLGLVLVRRRMDALIIDTFQSQAFGAS